MNRESSVATCKTNRSTDRCEIVSSDWVYKDSPQYWQTTPMDEHNPHDSLKHVLTLSASATVSPPRRPIACGDGC
jgi:hypothetical protein